MKWVNLHIVSAVFLLLLLLLLLLPAVTWAVVAKISFTTESQTVRPSTLSEPITIQAQDSSGTPFETEETIDLEFISSSETGEFLGASGNAAGKTMNRGTANRTFYYRDSKEGTFTITIEATGRDSGKEWTASQKIVISNSGSSQNTETGGSSNNSNSSYSVSSATSGATPVSNTKLNSSFEIYAGGDRLTAAGSPISFQAIVRKGDVSQRPNFSWSFGDGSVGGGQETYHIYKYPGTYAVVLSSQWGGMTALSRLSVRVIEPKLKISLGDGFVEITNESDDEVNLFNWKLMHGAQYFIFQPDTIMFPHASVRFDQDLLRFVPMGEIVLFDALGRKVVSNLEQVVIVEEEELIPKPITETIVPEITTKVEELPEPVENENKDQAAAIILYEEPQMEKKSWWQRLFDFFM